LTTLNIMMMKIAFVFIAALATVAYAQTPPCSVIDINNDINCDIFCVIGNGADNGTYTNGVCDCTTNGTTITACDNSSPRTYILAVLATQAPAQCQTLYNNVLSDDLLACFFNQTALNVLQSYGAYDTIFYPSTCDNTCANLVFGAATAFNADANGVMCSDALAVVSNNDDTPFNVTQINTIRAEADLMCATGGMGYCGDFRQALFLVDQLNSNISSTQCMTINNRGNCLGNHFAFLSSNYGVNTTSLLYKLNLSCGYFGIDVTAASSGTEAPADFSNGSFVAGSFFAVVAAALVAFFF